MAELRALWKGVIGVGAEISVPVKLYSAVRPNEGAVSFNLLHAPDLVPLRQVLVNEQTGEPVPREHQGRGYEVRRNRHVIVDESQLDNLTPEPSREIELLRFVEPHSIDPRFFLRSYYLGPDGDARVYTTLATALKRSERAGICRWVMRNTRYSGALQLLADGTISLTTLRQAQQLVEIAQPAGSVNTDARELKTARYLVQALEGEWDPSRYHDE